MFLKKRLLFLLLVIAYSNIAYSQITTDTADYKKFKELSALLKTDNDSIKASAYVDIAFFYLKKEIYKAIAYSDSALEITKTNNLPKIQSGAYYVKGLINSAKLDYKVAIDCFYKALLYYDKGSGTEDMTASTYNNISIAYMQLKLFDQADAYLNKAIKIWEDVGNYKSAYMALINKSQILTNIGKPEQAIKILSKLEIDTIGIDGFKISFYNSMGGAFKIEEKTDRALIYYNKALDIALIEKNKYAQAIIYLNIGDIYFSKKNSKNAYQYYTKTQKLLAQIDNKEIEMQMLQRIADYYADKNDYTNAYKNFYRYHYIEKEITDNNNLMHIAQITAEYQFRETEKELELIKVQDILKDTKLSNAQNKIYTFVIILIVVSLLVIVLFIFYLKKQVAYKKLIEKELKIITKDYEIKRIKKQNTTNTDNQIDENDKVLVEKINALLEDDKIYADQDLNRTKFASILDISVYKLSNIIKLNWQQNYTDFINEHRIRKALIYLQNPEKYNLSLAGIARSVGFRHGSSLTMIFKKHIGVSPSYYRKNIKEFQNLSD